MDDRAHVSANPLSLALRRSLLATAIDAAWAAGRHTLAYFQNDVAVQIKDDGTPVTVADREAELVARRVVAARFPGHAIVGEEHGATDTGSPFRWILDPIDGTKTFVRGVPLYGTLIACEHGGEVVAGVIHMPGLGEIVAAGKGLGCTWNGRPCRVSDRVDLGEALVATTDVRRIRQRSGAWDRIADATQLQRTWADCYGYALVATGRADVMIDPIASVWDLAACHIVVEEAGGRMTQWDGTGAHDGGEAVATNGALHDEVVRLLAG